MCTLVFCAKSSQIISNLIQTSNVSIFKRCFVFPFFTVELIIIHLTFAHTKLCVAWSCFVVIVVLGEYLRYLYPYPRWSLCFPCAGKVTQGDTVRSRYLAVTVLHITHSCCAVCNIVLYCTAIYRESRVKVSTGSDKTARYRTPKNHCNPFT